MVRKKQINNKYGLKPIILFIFFVLSILFISLILRGVYLIKESRFNASHAFYVEVSDSLSPSRFEIIYFAPDKHTISSLSVKFKSGFHSKENVQELVGIPIDARIIFNNKKDYDNFAKINSRIISSKIFYLLSKNNYSYIGLTPIDLVRLWIYAIGVKPDNVTVKEVQLPMSRDRLDQLDSLIFTDYTLLNDRMSIEVINNTNVAGLASRMARVITNIGGNVVMITSQTDTSLKESSISYFGKYTYTVDRLHKLFGLKVVKLSKPGISDIIINIAGNSLSTENF